MYICFFEGCFLISHHMSLNSEPISNFLERANLTILSVFSLYFLHALAYSASSSFGHYFQGSFHSYTVCIFKYALLFLFLYLPLKNLLSSLESNP